MPELCAWGKQFSGSFILLLKILLVAKVYIAYLKQKNVDKFQIVKEKKGIKNTVSYKLIRYNLCPQIGCKVWQSIDNKA